MAVYSLPDLDYDYGALDPHIAGEIMELHHSKHHAAYVAGANKALDQLAEARDKGEFDSVAGVERALAFNLGGHTNHSIFWTNLSPDGGDKPTGDLASAIDNDFGSFDAFQAHFTNNAMTVFGSGWSILVWDTIAKKLLIVQLYDQQGNVPIGLIPLLTLDMWEHAFYLQYKNVKADYIKAWWNVVNWANVQERFANAQGMSHVNL
ncbi:superoxide dismutase [Demequina sp.]|uniref:superoxide dismutase n=1 Tax=Demequina sp. TaxID=2050685 RepID=UPI003D0B475D